MRHDQPTTPFDVEADELTQQFWGTTKGWVSAEQPSVRTGASQPVRQRRAPRPDDTTGSMRAIREGFAALRPQTSAHATGEIRRRRQHGLPDERHRTELDDARREATLGELAAGRSDVGGWFDDEPLGEPVQRAGDRGRHQTRDVEPWDGEPWDDEPEYDVPLSPVQPLVERLGLGAVDPLLVRAGMIGVVLLLLVPLMLSLRPDRSDDSLRGEVVEVPAPAGAQPAAPVSTAPVPSTGNTSATPDDAAVTAAADATTVEAATASVATNGPTEPTTDPSAVTTVAATASSSSDLDAAAVDVAAERVVPECPQTYTAAAGDSWYRIADEAGVTPGELLAENNATTSSVILPGDDICLPAGAAMPTPPTTVAPVTTTPATTPTTDPPSTTVPATTVAPTANLSRTEVQELIRQTWPAEEVDTALAIARRESNFIATADNGWCCVGVFQLYWTVHRGWLDDFGIFQRSDLYDARKNIAAAYHMWQTQGWGPWGG